MGFSRALLLLMLSLLHALSATASSSPSSSQPRLRISQSERLNRRRLFERYLQLKAEQIPAAFARDLQSENLYYSVIDTTTGTAKTAAVPSEEGREFPILCTLWYRLDRVTGLHTSGGNSNDNGNITNGTRILLEPAISNSTSSTATGTGKRWNVQMFIPSFHAIMTVQMNGKLCEQRYIGSGNHTTTRTRSNTDFTSYGSIFVENAVITATLVLDGPNHQPHIVDLVDFDDHHWQVEKSNPTFQKLLEKIPQTPAALASVDQSIHDFIHHIFTERLQEVMEQQLTSDTDPSSESDSNEEARLGYGMSTKMMDLKLFS